MVLAFFSLRKSFTSDSVTLGAVHLKAILTFDSPRDWRVACTTMMWPQFAVLRMLAYWLMPQVPSQKKSLCTPRLLSPFPASLLPACTQAVELSAARYDRGQQCGGVEQHLGSEKRSLKTVKAASALGCQELEESSGEGHTTFILAFLRFFFKCLF